MDKVYFVRHQAHGIVHEFPFAAPPTDDQVAAVVRYCFQLHGACHPKTPDVPYWTKVVDRDVIGVGVVPEVPERALSVAGKAGEAHVDAAEFTVSGVGFVTKGGE